MMSRGLFARAFLAVVCVFIVYMCFVLSNLIVAVRCAHEHQLFAWDGGLSWSRCVAPPIVYREARY